MACHREVLNDGGYVAAESAAPPLLGMMCPSGERVWSSWCASPFLQGIGKQLKRLTFQVHTLEPCVYYLESTDMMEPVGEMSRSA